MNYKEYRPESYLSQHVESFWELKTTPVKSENNILIMPPEMNYDLIFVNKPVFVKLSDHAEYSRIVNGAYFIGLLTRGLIYNIPCGTEIFGIRLKPFSLANILKYPLKMLNNKIVELNQVFPLSDERLAGSVINCRSVEQKIEKAAMLITNIIGDKYEINQSLRSQLNYIMDNRGNVKISALYRIFDTNKVTLRNHFIDRIGITAKEAAKIWRFNNYLKLSNEFSSQNRTSLAMEAGYYDQSHLIKDFHTFLHCPPKQIISGKYPISISQERITRRFINYYDPF